MSKGIFMSLGHQYNCPNCGAEMREANNGKET